MSVAEKELIVSANNVIIAENVPKVYHAGQLSVISQSEALKGSAQGKGVTIKDISPVEHDMSVKLSGLPPIEAGSTIIPITRPYAFEDDEAQTGMTWTVADDGTITIDVDGTKTDGTNPWFIVENLVLPAGEYVISVMKSVTVTPETEGAMWAHSMHICDGDMYYGSGKTIKIVELPTDNSTYMPDVSFTLTKETAIWIDYMYGSAGVGMGRVPDRVVTEIKIELKSDVTYLPADYSGVKVQRLGKNLFNGELKIWENANRIGSKGCVKVKPNTVYTIYTFDYTISPPTFEIRGNHTGKYSMSDKQILGMTNIFNSGEYEYIWFREWKEMTQDGVTLESRVQVEEGRTATEYEPYIEPNEYTANADGTVDGIKSLYPSMTLTSDTEGVIITAEYIKDIDKAFEERLAALEAAIVNNE